MEKAEDEVEMPGEEEEEEEEEAKDLDSEDLERGGGGRGRERRRDKIARAGMQIVRRVVTVEHVEVAAKAAVTVSLTVTRALLHAPVQRFVNTENVAGLARELFKVFQRLYKDSGLSQPEIEITGEAFVTMLRLATQLSGPVRHVSPGELFDAGKAYALLQAYSGMEDPKGKRMSGLMGMLQRFSIPRHAKPPIEDISSAARYAFAAYGVRGTQFLDVLARVKTDLDVLDLLTGAKSDPNKEVLRSNFRSNFLGSVFKPGYFLLVDHESKEVILSVRGSFRLQDVVTDLVCEDVEFSAPSEAAAMAEFKKASEKANELEAKLRTPFFGDTEGGNGGELDSVFQNLSGALKNLRENLDSRGNVNLTELEDSLERLSSEVSEGTESALARAKSIVEAEDSGISKDRTHNGFLKSMTGLLLEVEDEIIEQMEKNEGYQLTLVGHSLGAAVATLLTFWWSTHPVLKGVRCFAIASPCSVSLDLAKSKLAKERIHNVILCDDVVPRLSLGSITDIRDSLVYIAENKIAERVVSIMEDKKDASDVELAKALKPIYKDIVQKTHNSFKLYPPGNSWLIPEMNGHLSEAILVPPEHFGTVKLSKNMFIAHLPNYYAHASNVE